LGPSDAGDDIVEEGCACAEVSLGLCAAVLSQRASDFFCCFGIFRFCSKNLKMSSVPDEAGATGLAPSPPASPAEASAAAAPGSAAAASAAPPTSPPPPALLAFLRELGSSHLYPTLLHLGVRGVGDCCTLRAGALVAERTTNGWRVSGTHLGRAIKMTLITTAEVPVLTF
jgi:hypothetical protein